MRPESWHRTVRFQNEEAFISGAAKATDHHSLAETDGASNLQNEGTRVSSDMRKNRAITAIAALYLVLHKEEG
ncbi:hypothetical protein [Streptomyces varsoviensis]|uniref:Uncharacterized protein n=1 Tax=Streptomyces varsoviensis TaxID=67373 RepID=A0ABR5J7F2_9ACTN|nr:hypothetical protein [Streptomyces varsoviensis]KOG89350.1 hypothetical protein ADK38_14775 [Streptomyces varsoviensis]